MFTWWTASHWVNIFITSFIGRNEMFSSYNRVFTVEWLRMWSYKSVCYWTECTEALLSSLFRPHEIVFVWSSRLGLRRSDWISVWWEMWAGLQMFGVFFFFPPSKRLLCLWWFMLRDGLCFAVNSWFVWCVLRRTPAWRACGVLNAPVRARECFFCGVGVSQVFFPCWWYEINFALFGICRVCCVTA